MSLRTICFFNSCLSWGGGEKWHLEMAHFLQARGLNVILISHPAAELTFRARESSIPLAQVHVGNLSFLNPFRLFKIARLFRHYRVQTVILNLPSDLKAAGIAARLAGIKKIIYRRGSAIPIRNSFLNRLLFRWVVTEVIANSDATKGTILARNPKLFPIDRIKVIYNGIDLDEFDSRPVQKVFSRVSGKLILGHAGRLSKEKNQKFLIDVVYDLKISGIDCTLLIAGKGSLEKELKSYAVSLGLENEIVFLGFQENMRAFMESIDVFLLASLWEGFGYVLIEAMAAAKPVVAFGNSSTPEIVKNGITGILVPPGDRQCFINALRDLAENADKMRALGNEGRSRVERTFSIQHSINQLIHTVTDSSSLS